MYFVDLFDGDPALPETRHLDGADFPDEDAAQGCMNRPHQYFPDTVLDETRFIVLSDEEQEIDVQEWSRY